MKRAVILVATILCLAAMCLSPGAALAQTPDKYPSKPVKIIVPYAPGGATDIVARILADQMSKRLGQSFYVESKPARSASSRLRTWCARPPTATR
jgi:tripartite-type tricarboxylate transporter receptor subunit TctC